MLSSALEDEQFLHLTKIGFNPSRGSEDFQRFPIFQQLGAMAAIFNIRQGQQTQF
jgi:hypothetical protein